MVERIGATTAVAIIAATAGAVTGAVGGERAASTATAAWWSQCKVWAGYWHSVDKKKSQIRGVFYYYFYYMIVSEFLLDGHSEKSIEAVFI